MKKTVSMFLTTMVVVMLASVSASAINWTQIGATDTNTYATIDSWARVEPEYSSVGSMPIEFAIVNGVIPNMKVTYTITLDGVSGWGDQWIGNSGLALFVSSAPAGTTEGLYTGVSHPSTGQNNGAITSNQSDVASPALSFVDSQTYDVTVEIVNGTATTTLAGINSSSYAVTSADISNWTGDLNFAAFKGGPGANWWVSRTFVTNVAFYADAPVPEPTSALTFATGLITLGGICIRRRRK